MANAYSTMPLARQKDLTRRGVLGAMTASMVAPHVTDAFPIFKHHNPPPNSPVVLPFVKDATDDERSDGANPRSFWNVAPTGHYGTDCDTGAAYAAVALDYMAITNTPQILHWAVFDMMARGRVHAGIEVGFMSTFGKIATNAHVRILQGEGGVE